MDWSYSEGVSLKTKNNPFWIDDPFFHTYVTTYDLFVGNVLQSGSLRLHMRAVTEWNSWMRWIYQIKNYSSGPLSSRSVSWWPGAAFLFVQGSVAIISYAMYHTGCNDANSYKSIGTPFWALGDTINAYFRPIFHDIIEVVNNMNYTASITK